jgi:hypothetical protein
MYTNSELCSIFRVFAVVSMLCRVDCEAEISAWLAIGSDWNHHFNNNEKNTERNGKGTEHFQFQTHVRSIQVLLDKRNIYCNEFAGSISQWKFITLKVQYTTVNYNQ